MLSFYEIIPGKDTIVRGEALNLLCVAYNRAAEDVTADIRVWGKTGGAWRPLRTHRIPLQAKEHNHLYFTLSPDLFTPAYWGEEIDELELCVSDREPGPRARAVLICISETNDPARGGKTT